MKITIKEIKELIKNTGFDFQYFHDLTGTLRNATHDVYIRNSNVLIRDNICITAKNRYKNIWTASDTSANKILFENMTLQDILTKLA